MSRILAIDPGGTTGLAFYDTDTDEFFSAEKEGYDDASCSIWNLCSTELRSNAEGGLDTVVCEGFVIRANTHKLDAGAFALTTDLVGLARFAAQHHSLHFVRQTPAQAKAFASNDKLRRLGWYHPSAGGHRNDAARHLLTYFARTQYAPVLNRLLDDDV